MGGFASMRVFLILCAIMMTVASKSSNNTSNTSNSSQTAAPSTNATITPTAKRPISTLTPSLPDCAECKACSNCCLGGAVFPQLDPQCADCAHCAVCSAEICPNDKRSAQYAKMVAKLTRSRQCNLTLPPECNLSEAELAANMADPYSSLNCSYGLEPRCDKGSEYAPAAIALLKTRESSFFGARRRRTPRGHGRSRGRIRKGLDRDAPFGTLQMGTGPSAFAIGVRPRWRKERGRCVDLAFLLDGNFDNISADASEEDFDETIGVPF